MRTMIIRSSLAAAAATTSVLLITGCTTSGTPKAADASSARPSTASSTAATTSGDPAKVKALVVTAADLPAGFTLTPLPEDQFRQAVSQFQGTTRTATITPSACADLQKLPDVDASKLGVAVATSRSGGILSEGLAAQSTDVAAARARATGPCKNFSITINTGAAAGTTATATNTVIAAPATRADPDDVLVLRQDEKVSTAGPVVTVTTYTGFASVNGYSVSALYTATTPGSTPDDSAFRQFFSAAVNKVATNG
ncbi:hypothetical protein EF294_18055 [Gordonia oryzae]|uniref:DUF5642 domain-containing protein n=1 Tax=Gordonia oryzae TaxID=2487349 RepID=A0A3N4GXJ7_9ACTN|nr:hypothetical protein [Gordonia oryzae]RPA57704.1 hypothetical protein EF294_18055 [Gordonia oryzae]